MGGAAGGTAAPVAGAWARFSDLTGFVSGYAVWFVRIWVRQSWFGLVGFRWVWLGSDGLGWVWLHLVVFGWRGGGGPGGRIWVAGLAMGRRPDGRSRWGRVGAGGPDGGNLV